MHERKIAYRPAFLRDVKRLKNKHYNMNTLKTAIQAISERLIDDFGDDGRVDLIERFAFPLPSTVICEMLGIPSDDQHQFRKWSNDIVAFSAGSGMVLDLNQRSAV